MPLKTHRDEPPAVNLTPMIDIVFLLIIFFMVGTKFTQMEKSIKLEVPQVSDVATLTSAPEKRVVSVYGDGRISLDDEIVTLQELEMALVKARQQYAETGVVVRGDAQGAFQYVADVLGACRQAGISDMGIAVRTASAPAKTYH